MSKPPFFIDIDSIQPSQLYLSLDKIEEIKRKYDEITPDIFEEVPIKKLNKDTIYTDGHTRAYILWQYGYDSIKVVWEDDNLDWEAYQICVDWCKAEGITKISDLKNRVINNESYQIKWIKRCQDLFKSLEYERKKQG